MENMVENMENCRLITDTHHGFMKGKFFLENFMPFCDGVSALLNEGRVYDIMYLDLCKTFVLVPGNILAFNLERCGVDGWKKNEQDGHTQRFVINSSISVRRTGMSGDPQVLILGPFSLPMFVRGVKSVFECPLGKTGDDTKVSGVFDDLEGGDGIQRAPDRLGIWAGGNMARCKILHPDGNNLSNGYQMADELIESIPKQKNWGCWWMKNWTRPSHVHPHTRNSLCLGLILTVWATGEEGILTPCSALELHVQLWAQRIWKIWTC